MIGEELKDKKFNSKYHVGKTLKDLEEGKYNLEDWNLQGDHTLIKNLVEKEIVSKKISEDTIEPSVVENRVETKIVTLPVPITMQPVVDDCKNIQCVSTQLCDNPG